MSSFLSRIFGSEKKAAIVKSTFADIGTDMHSHLIPGVDDGAANMSSSIFMTRFFIEMGFNKLITTPHTMQGAYDNTPEILHRGCKALQAEISTQRLPIKLEVATEYYFDDYFIKLVENDAPLMTFGDKKYLLFELPATTSPPQLKDILFKLNLSGYNPVMAHPERYIYYHNKQQTEYLELKEYNVLFQANILSFMGYYGKNIKTAVERLAVNGLIELAGSDIHHENHCKALPLSLENPIFQQLISSGKLINNKL